MTKSRQNLLEILIHDHHELEDMLGALTAARDPGERRRILDDVTIELAWYTAIEETHLYPAVRRHLSDGDRIAAKGMADNAEVERLLEELQGAMEVDRAFTALARRLIGEMNEHMREEEDALFPRLAAHADPEELRRLGTQVESALEDASTRRQVPSPVRMWPDGRRHDPPGRRPYTPRDPNPHDQSSMWPDLWGAHRTW
jgi:hypothetical protein